MNFRSRQPGYASVKMRSSKSQLSQAVVHGGLLCLGINNLFAALIIYILGALPGAAQPIASTEPVGQLLSPLCSLIDTTARLNALPADFFTRLIWQESRFQLEVVGPLTRNGEHAEGIAQFMPSTAAERGLPNPFNPAEALPKSAEFLAELRDEFGNLGLAAAAYNAGPQRLRNFLAGSRGLPSETRRYVLTITGRSVEEWASQTRAANESASVLARNLEDSPAMPTCSEVVALLQSAPAPSASEWQGRAVPAWCKGLSHPNVTVCGPVHSIALSLRTANLAMPRVHLHLFRSSPR